MSQAPEITDITELFDRPSLEVPDVLRRHGLLESTQVEDLRPADLRPFEVNAAPLVRLDPRHPHIGNHGMYASFPSGLHTFFTPPELLIWGTGDNYAYLILYFQNLVAGSYSASIEMQVWVNSKVSVTATGSAGVTVSSGSTSTPVTFSVPVKPNANGMAVVSMTPGTTDQGFSWFGTSLTKI
ncbi:hypothetical protein PZ938_03975 [Luteipulveratus sp. YIM 133132]|uniref:hypothetical protein n=1 Tax=Luteipulveratus flavus TaxID=3031728 RepID=UPI0023AEA184|nr:hypothetical protein [Luteipulveratus sp. YIM 133132]MDE9364752.1 hypothetical protein [Luteipulveratus sp. YIM 133132]